MSTITTEDIQKIAVMSGLALDPEELEKYRAQFEEILSYVEKLNEVDTSGIEPTYQVTGLKNITRKDVLVDYGVSTEDLLANAPNQQDDQIKVKRVL